jgi:hypothetical protein
MALAVVPVIDLYGSRPGPKGHYFFGRDLTDRRRMEPAPIRGPHGGGQDAGGGRRAQINNPLRTSSPTSISCGIRSRRSRRRAGGMAAGGDVGPALDEAGGAGRARQGAERVRNIVRDLRVFARGDEKRTGRVAARAGLVDQHRLERDLAPRPPGEGLRRHADGRGQ